MTEKTRIPTNLRTLLILEALGNAGRALSATEINAQIGLPKQTVHRLCATLESEGFLKPHGKSKKFLPSRRLRDLGTSMLFAAHLDIVRHQILQDTARLIGETVSYAVPEDGGMGYRDRAETQQPFRIQLPVGSNVPFHCSASGKMFIASLAPKARHGFVSGLRLDRMTKHTFTEIGALLDELMLTARRGYALDQQEFMDGMNAIAVPVRDPFGRYIASLVSHGPAVRLSVDDAERRKDILFDAAKRLTDSLAD